MQTVLFRLEVGVLLKKNDPEYKDYNCVYTKRHGFFDENQSIYLDYAEAKKEADEYIKNGVNGTYAVISSDGLYDISGLYEDEGEIQSMLNEQYCTQISYARICMDYFAYRNNKKIKTIIDRRSYNEKKYRNNRHNRRRY